MNNFFDFSTSENDFSATKLKKEAQKKKKDLIRNLPNIIVWALLIVAALATFADFKFANIKSFGFAANSILFAICSYMTYYLRKHTGMSRGKNDKAYVDAKEDHEKKCKEVLELYNGDITLADFCNDWVIEEVNQARKSVLSGTGVTDEEWQKFALLGKLVLKVSYSSKKLQSELEREKISQAEHDLLAALKALPGEKKMAICRACIIEKKRLAPADIIFESASREARERTPIHLKSVERRHDVKQLVSVTIMMTGVLSIVPEITALNFSITTIIYGLTRIASLLMTAFNADMNGETLYTVDAVDNFKVQDRFLELARNWIKKHEKQGTDCN